MSIYYFNFSVKVDTHRHSSVDYLFGNTISHRVLVIKKLGILLLRPCQWNVTVYCYGNTVIGQNAKVCKK